MGHATASFTLDVYGHVSDRMQEDSARRMEEYIQRVEKTGWGKHWGKFLGPTYFALKVRQNQKNTTDYIQIRGVFQRGRRDSDPRDGHPPYALSRGASSAT